MNVESVFVIKTEALNTIEELVALIDLSNFVSEKAPQRLLEEMIAKRFPDEEREAIHKACISNGKRMELLRGDTSMLGPISFKQSWLAESIGLSGPQFLTESRKAAICLS